MIPVLVLWAVPRSTSTAFERMMSQRGDHTCVHEPFGEVWYSIDHNQLLRDAYEVCLPHYQAMHSHRLTG